VAFGVLVTLPSSSCSSTIGLASDPLPTLATAARFVGSSLTTTSVVATMPSEAVAGAVIDCSNRRGGGRSETAKGERATSGCRRLLKLPPIRPGGTGMCTVFPAMLTGISWSPTRSIDTRTPLLPGPVPNHVQFFADNSASTAFARPASTDFLLEALSTKSKASAAVAAAAAPSCLLPACEWAAVPKFGPCSN
jgi:hypothetical protein